MSVHPVRELRLKQPSWYLYLNFRDCKGINTVQGYPIRTSDFRKRMPKLAFIMQFMKTNANVFPLT